MSYKSKDFLEMNYKLVKALNPDTPFHWIVVQNTPEPELGNDLAMDDSRFEIIKGPILTQQEQECSFYRSIHHAKALNLALAYTNAQLILILDPDCFILMCNWISIVLEYMRKEGLVFFGAPYHPKYYTHYRGFPNAICMFINRCLMQEKNYFSLDFMPVFEGRRLWNKALLDAVRHHSHPKQFLTFFSSASRRFPLELRDFHLIVKKVLKTLLLNFFSFKIQYYLQNECKQLRVRECRDTGYKIYAQYRSLLRYQTLKIFAFDQRNLQTKLIESILPDRYRTFPRDATFITKTVSPLFAEFIEHGEQFFWNHQLFGFHLKGVLDHLPKEAKEQWKEQVLRKIEGYISEGVRAL